jgi:Type I phosphodiesterase / nucleotide pyrophosphatase
MNSESDEKQAEGQANKKPQLLIVLVDAFSADYFGPDRTPFLYNLVKKAGGWAGPMIPEPLYGGVEPCLTGVGTLESGRLATFYRDPENAPLRNKYLPGMDKLPANQFGKAARMMYMRAATNNGNYIPPGHIPASMLKKLCMATDSSHPGKVDTNVLQQLEKSGHSLAWYSRDFPFEHKKSMGGQVFHRLYHDKVLEWVGDAVTVGCDIVYYEHSIELDVVGHKFGPYISLIEDRIKKVDNELLGIYRRSKSSDRDLHYLLISDHGMTKVREYFDLDAVMGTLGLWRNKDFDCIYNSTFAQIWMDNEEQLEALADHLDALDWGKAILSRDYPRYGIPQDPRWGDLLFVVDEGAMILPNDFQGTQRVYGMHGYFQYTGFSRSRPLVVGCGTGLPKPQTMPLPMTSVPDLIAGVFGETYSV